MNPRSAARAAAASTLIALVATQSAFGWGHDGHSMIDRLAAQFLPTDLPAFLRNGAALDAMDYLGPEPDRWHNKAELELRDTESPDHFIDLEYAKTLAAPFPKERYTYLFALEKALPAHPEIEVKPTQIGFQPYAVEENYERLKVDFREYRRLVTANADTAPVQLAIIHDAAILGHYVGDGSQPLHATIQFNGWTGPNPNGYDTGHKIHARFESTYVHDNINRDTDVAPLVSASKPMVIDDEWTQYLSYIDQDNAQVERVYQLDKVKGFEGAGTPEAKVFTSARLAAGAIELRDLIYSAWMHSADPVEEYKGPS